jgi:two-component system response regulator AtoC
LVAVLPSLAPKSSRRSGLELLVYVQRERTAYSLPPEGTISIGRSIENDVRLEQRSVSRRHLLLHISNGGVELEDMGSSNGTFFVGERREPAGMEARDADPADRRIPPRARVPLAFGEMIRIGVVFLLVHRLNPTTHHEALRESPTLTGPAIVVDPEVRRIHELGIRAARSDISVLLLGETGVGKEVLAETIHTHSGRAARPFLRLNCAALAETLLESELFGYEKGAFTGATSAKAGLLESTDGGTVFLDEIGELPMSTQVKLLRVLEDRAVRRIGGVRARRIDVRFVTATNRDLRRHVARGQFREDLYFRINGVKLELPPLRKRPSEIEPLARYFLHEFCVRCGIPEPQLTAGAIEQMLQYAWPGNVRELRNVMERAPFLVGEGPILAEHVPRNDQSSMLPRLRDEADQDDPTGVHAPPSTLEGMRSSIKDDQDRAVNVPGNGDGERERILRALESCGGNQTRAARLLGISRRTLVNRLDQFHLPRPKKGTP